MVVDRKPWLAGMLRTEDAAAPAAGLTDEPNAEDVARLVDELCEMAESIESRLLQLVREAARGAVAQEELSTESSSLLGELQRCYRQLTEVEDRRDLSFRTIATAERLSRRCFWLYRKIHLEQAFYAKLELETRLRSLISGEGYALYQRILCVEDGERGLLAQTDADLRRALLGLP